MSFSVPQTSICLILTGSGVDAHYNGAVCKTTATKSEGDQMKDDSSFNSCGNTQVDSAFANVCNPNIAMSYPTMVSTPISKRKEFSPESVKPHPKAPKRKMSSGSRKRRKTCILTDTPEKEALRLEQENRKSKCKQRNSQNKTKKTKLASKFKKQIQHSEYKLTQKYDETSDSDDEYFCLVCLDTWANSRPSEKWIECTICKMWAHDECADTRGMLSYICDNCLSDSD